MEPTQVDAILSLVPNAQCSIMNGVINWYNPKEAPVTDAEIAAELLRLQLEYHSKDYQRLRAAEYPPMADYLDGVVKGDQAQIDKYIADCLAVKAKYPKPSGLN